MIIFVEAGQLSASHFTGIANVIGQALLAWSEASPRDEFIVASHSAFNPTFAAKAAARSNISLRIDEVPKFVPKGVRNAFWFYFNVPRIVREIEPDLYWASATLVPFGLPKPLDVLTIVYDLVPLLHRHTMSRKGRIITAVSFKYSISRANYLWTISNYVREQMQHYLPEAAEKPTIVACAVDRSVFYQKDFSSLDRSTILKRIIPGNKSGPVLLFVGTVEPRKNLKFLVSLMPRLAPYGFSLIVVGGSGWGNALSNDAKSIIENPANNIYFAGRVSNDELSDLYNSSDLFVSTSIDEGFCMPAVESMSCGTPVVLANNSAMTEVAGSGGYLQMDWEADDWAATIMRGTRELTSEAALTQARRYSWEEQIKGLTLMLEGKRSNKNG